MSHQFPLRRGHRFRFCFHYNFYFYFFVTFLTFLHILFWLCFFRLNIFQFLMRSNTPSINGSVYSPYTNRKVSRCIFICCYFLFRFVLFSFSSIFAFIHAKFAILMSRFSVILTTFSIVFCVFIAVVARSCCFDA